MRARIPILVAAFLGAEPAMAAVSANCSFSDSKASFAAVAKLGAGDSIMAFDATLEFHAQAFPDDLRNVQFQLEHLTQRWLRGNDIKLVLYHLRERTATDPQVAVEVLIDTRRARPTTANYLGSYVLTIYFATKGKDRVVTVRGRAKCSIG